MNKLKLNNSLKFCRYQMGQSMVEYTVVITFGVLTLTTGPMKDQITTLMDKIRDNYRGYSFAISLSDIPDKDSDLEYGIMLDTQNVSKEMKRILTDRSSDNMPRSATKYHDEIKTHNIAIPNPKDIARNKYNEISSKVPGGLPPPPF